MNAEIERSSLNLFASELDQEEPMGSKSPEENKAMVLEAFDTLFNKRDYAKVAEALFSAFVCSPGRRALVFNSFPSFGRGFISRAQHEDFETSIAG